MRPAQAPLQLAVAPVVEPVLTPAELVATGGHAMPSRIEMLLARGEQAADLRAAKPSAWSAQQAIERLASGHEGLWIGRLDADGEDLPAGVRMRELEWSSSPMVIMRSDTDIRSWSDLRWRTVCVSADGRHAGRLARDFEAVEQLYPTAANALVALRTGECDAAVADRDFLEQLLSYPEWSKFSARLLPQAEEPLVALWSVRLPLAQRLQMRRLFNSSAVQEARKTQARSIAFEVYLQQEAPDCHS